MSIAPELKKLVDEGDLVQIRCFLANYLIVDRTFALFDESLAEVSAQLPIIQEFDGGVLEEDRSRWNTDYLNEQIVASFSNFSQKRIDHIKDVIRAVVNDKPKASTLPENLSSRGGSAVPRTGRTVISEQELPTSHGTPPAKHPNASPVKQEEPAMTGSTSRTGRCIVSETESVTEPKSVTQDRSHGNSVKAEGGASRTGRRVLSETVSASDADSDEDSVHKAAAGKNNTVGTAMIVGGAALAVVGVALAKPVVVVAGGAVAGAGVVVTVANKRR